MKKITSFLLAILICVGCFSAFPQKASAYKEDYISSTMKWTLYDNGLLVFSGIGVVQFGNYGFRPGYYEQVTEMVLSEGVTTLIFNGENLPNLKKITIPSTCTTITNAPYKCESLEKHEVSSANPNYKSSNGVLLERNKKENGTNDGTYTIMHYPAGKTTEKYTMDSSVTAVGDYAFLGNKHLKTLIFADSVTTIGMSAFENCTALSKVEFPLSLENLEGSAFQGCTSLVNVNLVGRLKTLGSEAFRECTSLKTISFPPTLERINSYCFFGCTSLEKVDLTNIKSIGHGALLSCHSLKNLNIPATLELYSYDDTVDMSYIAFLGNNYNLKSINVDSKNPYYCSVDGVLYSKDKTHLYSYPAGKPGKEYTTLQSAGYIEEKAFAGAKNLETLTIYAYDIDGEVLSDCDSLKKLIIKSKSISSKADFRLPNLETLVLPDYLKGTVELDTFLYCPKLPTEIVLPSGVNHISYLWDSIPSHIKTVYIFKSKELFENGEIIGSTWHNLKDDQRMLYFKDISLIRLDESGSCGENASFTLDKNGKLIITGTGAVDSYPWSEYPQFIKEVVVSEGISGIGANAFGGCAVRTITLPSSLTEVGANAFDGCEDLNMVIDYTANPEIAAGNSALTAAQWVRLEKGDVNEDGMIDNFDASIILKYDAGITQTLDKGDVNGDGVIDNFDASIILKYDAGLI